MPVLPEVGSTSMVSPGMIFPARSSASIMATPMRSLTLRERIEELELGQQIWPCTPFSLAVDASRTSGVSPIVSVIES